jgi:hypothetical protein
MLERPFFGIAISVPVGIFSAFWVTLQFGRLLSLPGLILLTASIGPF